MTLSDKSVEFIKYLEIQFPATIGHLPIKDKLIDIQEESQNATLALIKKYIELEANNVVSLQRDNLHYKLKTKYESCPSCKVSFSFVNLTDGKCSWCNNKLE